MFNFIYKAVVANNPDPIPNPSSALNSLQKHVVEDFSVPLLTVDPDPISNPSFILKAPRQGVIENGPQPLIRSRTDVIIRIYSRDFSASDVVLWRNGPSLQDNYKGHIPGMHAAGIVYMVEPGCKTLKAGDRVVFSPMSPCRVCIFCKSGVFNLCPQRRMMGVPPFDGTLSKYCVITEDLCTILPDNITFEEGALVGCYAIAFHICRRAGIKSGDSVIIFGENTGAYYCAAVARTCGATKVAVVGKGYHPYRQFSDSPEEIAAHIIHKHDLGEGAHVVIEASGMEALMNAGVCVLRSRGMYLQLFSNMYEYDRPMSFPMGMACVKEVVIRGSSSCLPDDFRTAMEMLASGKLSMGEVKKVYEFEDAQQAFEDAQREIQDANLMTCMADPGFQINGPKDDDE